jgi:activator of HSP90 ATPase
MNTVMAIIAATASTLIGCHATRTDAPVPARTDGRAPDTHAAPDPTTIHQEVDFDATPAQVYEALLDSDRFTAFSGRPAKIDRQAGGAFTLFSDHIVGRNLEVVPNHLIVQAWRVVPWSEGVYSIARFELQPRGKGTHLVFDHTAVPQGMKDHLAEGWQANYWTLMAKYFHPGAR